MVRISLTMNHTIRNTPRSVHISTRHHITYAGATAIHVPGAFQLMRSYRATP